MSKILILGGTREAAELAAKLVNDDHNVTTSLAGRTREPAPVSGKVISGGFGGAEGLANFLTEHKFEKLIDATHPFARQISANAKEAAQLAGVEFEIRTRKPWKKQAGDIWVSVTSLTKARDAIPAGARVLLALGSQYINEFGTREDVFYLVRMVDHPNRPLPLPKHRLLIGKPSMDWKQEAEILREHDISHIVCRNSGGSGAYAKIEAARKSGLKIIMIEQTEE